MYRTILMVLFTCLLATCGQIALKLGMSGIGRIGISDFNNYLIILHKMVLCPKIWLGLFIYIIVAISWMIILSRTDLSLAYPLLSINFVLITFAAWLFLGEPLIASRVAGVLIICFGIIILK